MKSHTMPIHSIINFAKYPFLEKGTSEYKKLLETSQTALSANGACEWPDFLTAEGLAELVRESQMLAPQAFFNTIVGNAYLESPDESLPVNHPRRRTEGTSLGVIAYDEYPREAILRRIYEFEPLMHFIKDVTQLRTIYRYADPMGGLNLSVMKDQDYLRWHFDQTDFVTSLAIQSAEEGGHFEFVPMIRSASDENYEDVARVLSGTHKKIQRISNLPGTLVLFKGRNSIHRVSTISGKTPRLMGLLAYDEKPDVMSSDHLRSIRYGRTNSYQTIP